MPTTEATRTPIGGQDYCIDSERRRLPDQSVFLARLAETVLQIPPFIQVYCSSPAGLGVHGLLRSVSPTGIQVLIPISLPLRSTVEVTIANCRSLVGEVLFCVKKSSVYQVGFVFSTHYKPEISVGGVAVIKSLDEPLTLTRGNVLDVGRTRMSIFCKTMLAPGAWVRVEANGWILFGLVEAVVATSMLACCVDIHLEAAFPAASSPPSPRPQPFEETADDPLPAGLLGRSSARDEAGLLNSNARTSEREECFASC